ncbi:MAG: hypothetical protein V8S24_04400 [Gordonibacter pamelaeae]
MIKEKVDKFKEKYGPNSLTVLSGTGREAGRYHVRRDAPRSCS